MGVIILEMREEIRYKKYKTENNQKGKKDFIWRNNLTITKSF